LSRASVADRGRVFEALNAAVPAPEGVTREGIVRGEQAMLDAWWNQLGFDDIAIWENVGKIGSWKLEVPRLTGWLVSASSNSEGSTSKETTEYESHNVGCMRWMGSLMAASLIFAAPALAGPPLICHAIDIGTAQSLPWSSTGWNLTGHENYDVGRVVADTLALLVPETPVLVRMETMRRATLFAAQRADLATDLLKRLEARTTRESQRCAGGV